MGGGSSAPQVPSSKPVLYYMPFSGRGEMTRIIAKTGGLEIAEEGELSDKASFGSPSSLPCLLHGDLKLSQSHAIVNYVLNITPKFRGMDPGHKAKDMQFNAILDDLMSEFAKVLFNPDKSNAKADITKAGDKWYGIIEGLVPANGYVNGRSFPTGADYACLIMAKGFMPFGAGMKVGSYDPLPQCPKFKALVDRTANFPAVKEYLAQTTTLTANPMGI
eukprot:CAMPEP_0204533416 /NCGR_PEP_ID=MMETSP0661-20131031/12272_1 /ASSEMBLY_ACC=CAM_ASM_000606 /TAXON_ID=109239 /ORGANISM="Alexandrium margalefi, Strain AMGDE01CS-322" /LENGTH=218 /DNA_ID=CAMNT_0051539755 /DNA_START=89 /DNA_END=745 /DNA_ORIENTATION=-